MCGKRISYGWRSIQAGKDLLQKGLRVQLGDGTRTNIWREKWLPTLPPRRVLGECFRSIERRSEGMGYKKLQAILEEGDAKLAKQIILAKHNMLDSYIWSDNKDGDYSVRSGYWVSTHVETEETVEQAHGSLLLKKEIWKLKILPKIKHFLWRVISEALPTATRMLTRKIPIDPICQRCCLEDESINHVLFECIHAKAIWRCAHIPGIDAMNPMISLEDNVSQECASNEEVKRSLVGVEEWLSVYHLDEEEEEQRDRTRCSKWLPPQQDMLKCNFDSTFKRGDEFTGVSWIIRDHNGKHIRSGTTKVMHVFSPLQAEVVGFLHAIQMVWIQGFRKVHFESDNKELVNVINKRERHVEIGNTLYDIWYWLTKLPQGCIGHTNRERNHVADQLAKKASTFDSMYDVFTLPPSWLIDSLYYPFTI